MTNILANVLPDLVSTVATALRSKGFRPQAAALATSRIERWTYDPSVDAGYIYLVQNDPIQPGETPAAQTIPFMDNEWFNVDLRASGEIFGIELLSHANIFRELESYEGGFH